ncbi:hypothetical protein F4780DRAFT_743948 [Xylariomycetidae sp. FL0641]|nr:hypothetical protein F4780DRAFT_743948 [Xylariomycetidae sp. FL0641]
MQFSNILSTAAAALALGANAGVLPPRQNGEIAQFRVYGAEGCSDLNLGFYPVYAEDKGVCKSLTDADDVVLSVALELNTENACARKSARPC